MATVTLKQQVCDVCTESSAQTYFVQAAGRGLELDLCPKHSRNLDELLEKHGRPGRPRRRPRANGIVVSQPKPRTTPIPPVKKPAAKAPAKSVVVKTGVSPRKSPRSK